MNKLMNGVKSFLRNEDGVTMVEYGLIAGLISIVVIIALTGVGKNLNAIYTLICQKVAGAVTAGGGTALGCS